MNKDTEAAIFVGCFIAACIMAFIGFYMHTTCKNLGYLYGVKTKNIGITCYANTQAGVMPMKEYRRLTFQTKSEETKV